MDQWLRQHRRHLHQHPELSLKEYATSEYCQKVLAELGFNIEPCWKTGFIANLSHPMAKKTIALRADMDALPIQELNQHQFCSKNPGVAHLCGHDAHMSIALGAAKIISAQKPVVNVRFLFQPSEESPPGGALSMIEQGCLEEVDEVYGLHNDPGTPVGTVKTRVGSLMACADRFDLTIKGVGCHAARPHDGLDPITAGCELIGQWQRIISRFINPAHQAVLSVGSFHSGETFNVIPQTAEIKGTVRTFTPQDRITIQNLLESSLANLNAQNYQCEFNYTQGYPSVINHRLGVEAVTRAAASIQEIEHTITDCEPQGWGEDFAYYLQHKPGAFFFLGSGNESLHAPLHSPVFDIDERCLSIGAKLMAQIVLASKQ